ncbi:MAG: ribokinase [Clostridia bacterium]|nr:ribokinase [Clostridia bacterium]
MDRSTRIAVVGSANVDLTVFTSVVPRAGETVLGETFQMSIGGKGTNQATAARRAGSEVTMVTKVGDDSLAEFLRSHYRSEGIDTRYVATVPDCATGTATIIVDTNSGENRIVVASGANAAIGEADCFAAEAAIAEADALVLQLEIAPQAALAAAKLAKRHGKLCILNPAPAAKLPKELFACTDYFTPNETEAEFYTGIAIQTIDDAFRAGKALLELGIGCAVITLGALGAVLVREDLCVHVPTIAVEAVDTTGAGDCFNGVLAVALAEGLDEVAAVRRAAIAASLAVGVRGAAVSCPTRAAIDAAL